MRLLLALAEFSARTRSLLAGAIRPGRAFATATLCTAGLACSTGSSTATIQPLTAIVVHASDLTSSRGCGTDGNKVFKYAVVVDQTALADGGPVDVPDVSKGVYDCYVDAFFTFPITADFPTAKYRLEIVAMDATEYDTQRLQVDPIANRDQALDTAAFNGLRGQRYTCDVTLRYQVISTAACSLVTSS